MNLKLVSRLIGIVAILIGSTMSMCLPWALPAWGVLTFAKTDHQFESGGFSGLLISMVLSLLVGGLLYFPCRLEKGRLFLKEAMAVVALSWIMATILGAMPFLFSGTMRGPMLRTFGAKSAPLACISNWQPWGHWHELKQLDVDESVIIEGLQESGYNGIVDADFQKRYGDQGIEVIESLRKTAPWDQVLITPDSPGEQGPSNSYRVRWIRMGVADALFESQSGFSTTGATVISDLENPELVPRCILFWRSLTHFLGGLGIIVLFVTILGQGSAGKALMRAEMPGPKKEGSTARMQHTAWIFAFLYCGLNVVLAIIYWLLGMTPFDAMCHAFGTMATGGFSTYNASLGQFAQADLSTGVAIEYVTIVFMILAGTNFILLYLMLILQPGKLFRDVEWRVYIGIIAVVTTVVVIAGMVRARTDSFETFEATFRASLFQVVSIMTTTGYGTSDFDVWPDVSRGLLLLLMFVGGCAGSTGGGMKVIRHVLFFKIITLEMERSFHPRVVRPLRIGGEPADDQLRASIFLYSALILALFIISWVVVITVEPPAIWGHASNQKLIDSASAVAATLNNIGPGLGIVGPTQNYGQLTALTKFLFVWLMMLGRLEIYSILALAFPRFWRD